MIVVLDLLTIIMKMEQSTPQTHYDYYGFDLISERYINFRVVRGSWMSTVIECRHLSARESFSLRLFILDDNNILQMPTDREISILIKNHPEHFI